MEAEWWATARASIPPPTPPPLGYANLRERLTRVTVVIAHEEAVPTRVIVFTVEIAVRVLPVLVVRAIPPDPARCRRVFPPVVTSSNS